MNPLYTSGPETFAGPYPMLVETPRTFAHDPQASPTLSKDGQFMQYTGGMNQNEKVIRGYIPDAARIEFVASHAVVYEFVPESKGWIKSGVEGSLFIISKALRDIGGKLQATEYAVFVMNRQGLDNFEMNISQTEIDCVDAIIVLMDKDHVTAFGDMNEGLENPQVCGIWVFADPDSSTAGDRDAVYSKLKEFKQELDFNVLAPLKVGPDSHGLDFSLGSWFHSPNQDNIT